MLATHPPTATPSGNVPKGNVMSCQAMEYEKPQTASQPLPSLPLSIIENTPCAFDVRTEQEHSQLSKMNVTLGEARMLELLKYTSTIPVNEVEGVKGWKGYCITLW